MSKSDVTIIGAGPYGLSAAAHLRTIAGLDVRLFGKPMSFWERNMPMGMYLRTGWDATHIADPAHALTLEAFQAASSTHFSKPVPLDRFVQYGQWYQRQALPDLDQREVVRVEASRTDFGSRSKTANRSIRTESSSLLAFIPLPGGHRNSLIWTVRSSRTPRNIGTFAGLRAGKCL